LTGLVGAGRSELLGTIFGNMPRDSGEIYINGEKVNIRRTKDAIRYGIGMVPEDRKERGIYKGLTVNDNITSVRLRVLANKLGIINPKRTKHLSKEYCEKLNIKTPNSLEIINNLSGGNQQKCILARWLANEPKILLLDEPTHGIDIGTKTEIYKLAWQLAKEGCSIIFLSSELPEVLTVCDRIMVMHHGELRGIVAHKEATEVKLMSYTLEENAVSNA